MKRDTMKNTRPGFTAEDDLPPIVRGNALQAALFWGSLSFGAAIMGWALIETLIHTGGAL